MSSGRARRRRYKNRHLGRVRRGLLHLALWCAGYYEDIFPLTPVPEDFSYPNPKTSVALQEPTVTWINHSTFLVRIDGVSILTDPIWVDRCSPLKFIGPRRLHEPAFELDALPPIDFVLISHNHYDHLDRRTVLRLAEQHPQIQWCVPLGLTRWFSRLGIERVIELDWWESVQSFALEAGAPQLEVFSVPAQHYSGRGLFDRDRTLWSGWVVRVHRGCGGTKAFYFAGDTGYNEHDFKKLKSVFGGMDLSLIPIGVYVPQRFMRAVHASPQDAVSIHRDVGSSLSIGAHWNTFRLSGEPRRQPPYDLYCAMQNHSLPLDSFRVLDPGQMINW